MVLGPIAKGLGQGGHAPSFSYVDPVARAHVTLARMRNQEKMKELGGRYELSRMQFFHYQESLRGAVEKYKQSRIYSPEYKKALEDIQFFRERLSEVTPNYLELKKEYDRAEKSYENLMKTEKELNSDVGRKESLMLNLRDFLLRKESPIEKPKERKEKGSGEVKVRAHEREGHPVKAHTRSYPED